MPTRTPWIGLAAWMLAVIPCQAGDVTAIVGATVVHPDRDLPSAIASNSTVIIAGSRIEAIGPAGSTPVPAGAARIDRKSTRLNSRHSQISDAVFFLKKKKKSKPQARRPHVNAPQR